MRACRALYLGALLAVAAPAETSAQTFSDVPASYWAYSFIETFAARGITSGCGGGAYCPDNSVTRAQMAVFLERGMRGAGFTPPPASGTLFNDVGANDFAAAFIEQLFNDGITGGCGGGNYCPTNPVTRAQMAVFLLRAMYGANYTPPPATGVFNDVPPGSFADAWIEQLAVEQITGGCGGGNFCPNDTVTRAQMAVFIVRALLEPPVLTSIQLSQTAVVLDRWGDAATITATAVDQDGLEVPGATITWMSSDADIAAVDNAGNVSTWLGGNVMLTAEASKDGTTVNETVNVTVAIQRNPNCTVPTEFPVQGPVNPPGLWDVRILDTTIMPDGSPNVSQIGLHITVDADRDGDPDVLSHVHTPWFMGIGVPIETEVRLWLNDGAGNLSDGTNAFPGLSGIPWLSPRDLAYADLDADGFTDVVAFQQGHEYHENACGNGPGSCPGGPTLLLLPQPGDLSDSANTRLNPYDVDGFTHSGAVGDIDCDGDVDIFEAQWGGEGDASHRMQINSGTGTFVSEESRLPQELLQGVSIAGSAMCDFDRDGDPDLVNTIPDVTSENIPPGFSADYGIRVSVNDGFGQFRMLREDVLPPHYPTHNLDCADLDLDGYADIIPNRPAVSVLRHTGDMSFVDETANLLPANPQNLPSTGQGIIDLNDDAWPDLVSERDQSVYWNTGAGVFDRRFLPGIDFLTQMTMGDFDGNGRPDIYHYKARTPDVRNYLFFGHPSPAPVRRVFVTSSQYTADLGGIAGADAICQQHANDAGMQGTFIAYISDSNTDAINRIPHAEYRRIGDDAAVASSKLNFIQPGQLLLAIANDEFGATIPVSSHAVRTGTNRNGGRRSAAANGVGFCSDWTRATNEFPGLAGAGRTTTTNLRWVLDTDSPCSEPQRLYCFEE